MDKRYTVWASNEQGASCAVADGARFSSRKAAMQAARATMGRGWKIHVEDGDGNEYETFTIR